MSEKTLASNKMPELNWLRGVSAILVVLYHFTTRYQDYFGINPDWKANFPWGCAAVNVFFILSGFLTALTLKDDMKVTDYIKKRFIRLYPAYWVCIIITSVAMLLLWAERYVGIKTILINFTMLQGVLPGVRTVDGVYWTLRYELQFYVYIAIILFIRKGKWLKHLALLGTVLSGGLAIAEGIIGRITVIQLGRLALLDSYGVSFFGGIFLCCLMKNSFKDIESFVGLALCVVQSYFLHTKPYFVAYLITVAFIIAVIVLNSQKKFDYKSKVSFADRTYLRWLSFVAKISFPLYLLHQNIGMAIIHNLGEIGWTNEFVILIAIVVSILLAWLVNRFVEKPIAKWFSFKKRAKKVEF